MSINKNNLKNNISNLQTNQKYQNSTNYYSNNLQTASSNNYISSATLSLNNIQPSYSKLSENDYKSNKSNDYIIERLFTHYEMAPSTIRALLADPEISKSIDFYVLVKTQKLPMPFIKDFYDKLPKSALYLYQDISFDFIEKHFLEYLNMDENEKQNILNNMAQKQDLPFDFVEKNLQYFDWEYLFKNKNLVFSLKTLLQYQNNFSKQAYMEMINIKNFDKIVNNFIQNMDMENYEKMAWSYISWNIVLEEETLWKCLDYIDFNSPLLSNRIFKDDTITCYRLLKYNF